jgi:uncharacterized membrane protein
VVDPEAENVALVADGVPVAVNVGGVVVPLAEKVALVVDGVPELE